MSPNIFSQLVNADPKQSMPPKIWDLHCIYNDVWRQKFISNKGGVTEYQPLYFMLNLNDCTFCVHCACICRRWSLGHKIDTHCTY